MEVQSCVRVTGYETHMGDYMYGRSYVVVFVGRGRWGVMKKKNGVRVLRCQRGAEGALRSCA